MKSRDWLTIKLRRFTLGALLCLLAPALPLCASAGDLVFEFKGSTSRTTPEFKVKAPWVLEWRTTSNGSPQMAVDIGLYGAGTGVYEGRVLTTKFPGNGVKLFDLDGEFYFRVDSSFSTWSLKVVELSAAEAAQYTPRADSQ